MPVNSDRKIRLTLYKVHDYDLVCYYASLRNKNLKNAKTSFVSVIKEALKAYVRSEEYHAPALKNYEAEDLPSKINVRFTLNAKYEKDIIAVLEQIKDRQLNSFVKNTLRRYMPTSDLKMYYTANTVISLAAKTQNTVKKQKAYEKAIKKVSPHAVQTTPVDQIAPVNNEETEVVNQPVVSVQPTKEPTPAEVVSYTPPMVAPEEESSDGFDFFAALGNIN